MAPRKGNKWWLSGAGGTASLRRGGRAGTPQHHTAINPVWPLSTPRVPEHRRPGIPCRRETECNGGRGMRANRVSWPLSRCRTAPGCSRVRQGHDETHLCRQDRAEPRATVPITAPLQRKWAIHIPIPQVQGVDQTPIGRGKWSRGRNPKCNSPVGCYPLDIPARALIGPDSPGRWPLPRGLGSLTSAAVRHATTCSK